MSSTKTIERRGEPSSSTKETNPNDIKFGITTPFRDSDKGGELVLLSHDKPISHAVETVCKIWSYKNHEDYALKFSEAPYHYVTEGRRKELSGKLVSMQHSPGKVLGDVLTKLKGGDKEIVEGLTKLATVASDPTVADVFVSLDALPVLLELMEREPKVLGVEGMACALQALLDVMLLSSDATWDKVTPKVISRVASYINNPTKVPANLLGPALQVLENAITSGLAYEQLEKEITLPIVIKIVTNPDGRVQQNALALINALLTKADMTKRKYLAATLSNRTYRDIIVQHVINKKPGERLSETNHELYVMQTLLLNLLDERRRTPVSVQEKDKECDEILRITELFKIAFESEHSAGNYASPNFDTLSSTNSLRRGKLDANRDFTRLGFSNASKPELDLLQVPPGSLALDCMHHLATVHTDGYHKVVLEGICRSAGDECPFARSSLALVNVLCDLLKIGESPEEQAGTFYPFFFQHDKPFEELYCVCAQLVTKTWKEMRATSEDFDKVFDVVKEQLHRSLRKTPEDLETLKKLLNSLSYAEIMNIRQQERSSREEWELQAKPIQELKAKLEPEMIELIKQNRVNHLISGTRFNKFASRGLALIRVKEKFWFCRLSPNKKIFHYGECEEKATPLPEELPSKINVADIKDLLTGKDCPHNKETKAKKSSGSLAFSLVTEKESLQTQDFVAPDKRTFDLWTDGINALLGKPMTSDAAKEDLEILLHMELKLRLLEIDGIELPTEPPPIPELPDNFDFSSLQINGK